MKTEVVVGTKDSALNAVYAWSKANKVYFIEQDCTLHQSIVESMRKAVQTCGLETIRISRLKGGPDPANACLAVKFRRRTDDCVMRDIAVMIMQYGVNRKDFEISAELRARISVESSAKAVQRHSGKTSQTMRRSPVASTR